MALIDSARRIQEECKTQGLLWQTMKQHWMTALRELAGDLRRLSAWEIGSRAQTTSRYKWSFASFAIANACNCRQRPYLLMAHVHLKEPHE